MTVRILNFPDGFSSPTAPFDLSGSYVSFDSQEIGSGGEIDTTNQGMQKRPIKGDGAVTTSTTPFGTDGWDNGIIITLLGEDATNTVTIPESSIEDYGAFINGPITLGKGHSITLQWDQTSLRLYEIGRNI
jgi:hypothetical protein